MTETVTPVLMLARNCQYMTLQAARSVFAQDVPVWLWVLSQGSTDGINEALMIMHARGKPITLITSPKNLGVSAGWNLGLRYLFDRLKLPYVLVVNNDVVLRKDCARILVEDGGPFVTGVGVDSLEESLGEVALSRRNHPDYSCWLMRREVWQRVGEFDETMVSWASDGDMHLRLHRAGIPAYTCGLPFYHIASGTLKNTPREENQALREQADRDRDTFRRKWGVSMGTPEYENLFTAVGQAAGTGAD